MSTKLRVGVLFGGRSSEHDVSLLSVASILEVIDMKKYIVSICGITKQGLWTFGEDALSMLGSRIAPHIAEQLDLTFSAGEAKIPPAAYFDTVDVIFPVLHGPYGEDGRVQGLLEFADVPYVGCRSLSSALTFDKMMTKRLLGAEGIPQVDYVYFTTDDYARDRDGCVREIIQKLEYPLFVKPANMGSSIGISRVMNEAELDEAIRVAGKYDSKLIVEQGVCEAREIEVAVLGNDDPIASLPGEIISNGQFYDYYHKYTEGKSSLQIPADISHELAERLRQLAIKVYKSLDCRGLTRIDFLLDKETGDVFVSEPNSMPGFTEFSMYTKMMTYYLDLTYAELISKLIEYALEGKEILLEA